MSESEKEKRFEVLKGRRIYQIFIDRFAGHKTEYTEEELKKGFLYGNIKALMSKIDYIKSMNFDMIWLSPFYVNQKNGYHGYHVVNYNHVDPRFAYGEKPEDENIGNPLDENDVNLETSSDLVLKKFVELCHEKNMKIMMDLVPNHVYETHPFFIDAKNNENSKYRDWFYFIKEEKKETKKKGKKKRKTPKKSIKKDNTIELKEEEEKNYTYHHLSFLGFNDLPKLNLENEDCLNHIINSTKKFLSYGIDAVRIDHILGPSKNSIKKMVEKIHETYSNVPFVMEFLPFGIPQKNYDTIKAIDKENLKKFKEIDLNTAKNLDENFLTYDNIVDGALDVAFFALIDLFLRKKLTEEQCNKEIEEHFKRYENHKNFILVKHVDSHDSDRLMYRCHGNMLLFEKAINMLNTKYLGRNDPIVIFYGTEDLMSQEKSIFGEPFGDFRCRLPMYFLNTFIKNVFKE